MGTIKQGILGGFSGKVGTVVGGSWKGISYMRVLAQNVKNPRTDAQMNPRSNFALAMAFLKPITNYVPLPPVRLYRMAGTKKYLISF